VDDSRLDRGLIVGFAGMALLLGPSLEASALTALGAALLALLAGAHQLARRRLASLHVRRETEGWAFEDDEATVHLLLENHGRRPATLVEIVDSFGPALADRQALLDVGPLPGGRRRRLVYRTSCSRLWGVYTVGPVTLSASDPLGLFARRKVVPEASPFDLFPRVHPVADLERLGARPSFAPSEPTAPRSGQSALYIGIRDHRPGDGLRRVHWPATARRGSPMTKELERDLTPYFTLFLDLHRRHRAGTGRKSTLEYVVRTAASLLATAARRGDVVQAFGEAREPLFVPPGRGELHLARALDLVIRIRQDGRASLLDVVEENQAGIPAGSTVALLAATLFLDLGRLAEALAWMQSRHLLPVVVAVDEDSFVPIDRRARPREEVLAQRAELVSLLRSRGARGAVLDADLRLDQELGRPHWLEAS
jgi:uncharacterized protein (DUF58 family)